MRAAGQKRTPIELRRTTRHKKIPLKIQKYFKKIVVLNFIALKQLWFKLYKIFENFFDILQWAE